MLRKIFGVFVVSFLVFVASAIAQTSAFVYQGKLNDGGTAANGTYQFEFKMFDAASGGDQIGQTLSNIPATVSGGIFTVSLDFGASSFDGTPRYLEIGVRFNNSGQPYTLLNPRQPVTSTPYAVRSLNANQANTAVTSQNSQNLGGIPAASYTQNNDPRLSDARPPTPFSTYYIQNGTSQQATSNFNISGTGKADVLEAKTQFNINGERVFHTTGASNLFAGVNAGKNTTGVANAFYGFNAGFLNTSGQDNAFFGQSAGVNNTIGSSNSFFGNGAGFYNKDGGSNSYFGYLAGNDTTSGSYNSFFGSRAGYKNTVGQDNAFFGQAAGFVNTEGDSNAFFGNGAGLKNTKGSNNVFLGALSGDSNTIENNNIFIGYKADGAAGITNAIAIGANAKATQSNTMVLGTSTITVQVPGNLTVANTFGANALNSATNYQIGGVRVLSNAGTDNLFAGIGSGNVTTGGFNAFFGAQSGKVNTTGFNNTFVGAYSGAANQTGANNAFFGANSGSSNVGGSTNSFFGANSGFSNISGNNNSFFGNSAGFNNNGGLNNSFFGRSAGANVTNAGSNAFFGAFSGENTTTGGNSFFGANAGQSNTSGFNNTFIGFNADSTGNVTNSIAIGANVKVTTSNTAQIGTAAMTVKLPGAVEINSASINSAGINSASFGSASINTTLNVGGKLTANGSLDVGGSLKVTGGVSAASIASDNASIELLSANRLLTGSAGMQGETFIATIKYGSDNGAGGASDFICRGESDAIFRPCFAAFTSKAKNVSNFTGSSNVIKNLRVVAFNSETDNRPDVALTVADDANADPLFVRRGAGGAIETVRYKQIIVALVGAAQEQQAEIEARKNDNQKLQTQLEAQRQQIDALKKLICQTNLNAAICQSK